MTVLSRPFPPWEGDRARPSVAKASLAAQTCSLRPTIVSDARRAAASLVVMRLHLQTRGPCGTSANVTGRHNGAARLGSEHEPASRWAGLRRRHAAAPRVERR